MKWISVNERLPEELQAVLVHGECANEYYKGFEVTWLSHGHWVGDVHPVTHWMALPQPPDSRQL